MEVMCVVKGVKGEEEPFLTTIIIIDHHLARSISDEQTLVPRGCFLFVFSPQHPNEYQ